MSESRERWDIFCRVVDNYGYVGVSWRLARQLAREHAKDARLWLDDLTVLAKLRPEIDTAYEAQRLDGVEVRLLREPFDLDEVADVVVETFGCDPPEPYVLAMAERGVKPRWINLEYLSGEEWVEGSHALPSPNPRLPLVKHYFFPGFTRGTGGLLREESLLRRRDEFQRDEGAQAAFWKSIVGAAPPEGALKVSLFNYAFAPVESLARACAQFPGPVWLIAPEGIAATSLESWRLSEGARGAIQTFVIPFLAQDRYDQLLWACDVNFVRGEDSFVRAQWAAKPFIWHIYPQDENLHHLKLRAFLQRYAVDADGTIDSVGAASEDWNGGVAANEGWAGLWPALQADMPRIAARAGAWQALMLENGDLASNLLAFARPAGRTE